MDKFDVLQGEMLAMTPKGLGGYNANGVIATGFPLVDKVNELYGQLADIETEFWQPLEAILQKGKSIYESYNSWNRQCASDIANNKNQTHCGAHQIERKKFYRAGMNKFLREDVVPVVDAFKEKFPSYKGSFYPYTSNSNISNKEIIPYMLSHSGGHQEFTSTNTETLYYPKAVEMLKKNYEELRREIQSEIDRLESSPSYKLQFDAYEKQQAAKQKAETQGALQRDLEEAASERQMRGLYLGYALIGVVVIAGGIYGIRQWRKGSK